MDRALDEIVAERNRGKRLQGRRTDRRPERNTYSREGIRKSTWSNSRNIDSEWVHDKFDENSSRQSSRNNRRYSPSPENDAPSAKLRIENLHYDLTEDDLDGLFNRIGPVLELSLIYDRAGRSEGIAYVTYEYSHHAKRAIQEFDGANAKGQPIHLISIPSGPSGRRRYAAPPRNRSLFDRVTVANRSPRSNSGHDSEMNSRTERKYERSASVNNTNSRGPKFHRRDGRRIGERNNGGLRGERLARDNRPKKTQEELDADMDEYWNSKDNNPADIAPVANTVAVEDEMRE